MRKKKPSEVVVAIESFKDTLVACTTIIFILIFGVSLIVCNQLSSISQDVDSTRYLVGSIEYDVSKIKEDTLSTRVRVGVTNELIARHIRKELKCK
jgi:hypothetical protein